MRYQRRKLEVAPPYVSMADIAFNLVLFFIIMAKTQDDSHIQWEPAKAAETKPVANSRATIMVDKDNKVYLNGQQVGIRDLSDAVARQLSGVTQENRTVLLKIHKETLAATFEPIMEAVSQAGGDVVNIVEDDR